MVHEALPAGTLIDGRYRLLGLIGQGGMSAVYDGLDLQLSRRVAVKLIARASEQEDVGERLFREARAAARSDHPAVVTTFGYGVDAELSLSYLVTERLLGETLAERIQRAGRLPPAFVCELALELLDALSAVHAADVIHRDLKPSNIFLAQLGRRNDVVKLLDFGVARLLDLHTLTATGEVYGTLMYMAPEQLRDARDADARSDLYSLGLIMLEALTGKPPFASRNLVALATSILAGVTLDTAKFAADQTWLVEFIRTCTAPRPQDRFADAASAHAALRARVA